jgi:hypothetical protein
MPIDVECSFDTFGRVRIWRLKLGGRWRMVEQGRQWQDADGRHILIMLPDRSPGVHELWLRADTLTWELRELPGARAAV